MAGEFDVQPLGSVAKVRSGYAFKSDDMGAVGLPVIKIKNVAPPTVDITDCERVPEEVISRIPRVERFELKEGDTLIAMTGATVGKVGRFPRTKERHFLNQRVGKVYLTEPDAADYRYIYFILSQDTYVRQMFGIADGSAQANISGSQIESLEVPLPPLSEQRAIASVLGTLDDLIELNRETNEILEEMARALFKSWFVDFDPVRAKLEGLAPAGMDAATAALFPDHFQDTELGQIPRGWEQRRWGDIVTLEYGKSLRDYRENGGPYRVFGTNGPIGNHSEALCKEAGIVIGRKGAYRGVHYSPEPFFVIDTAFYLKPKKPFDLKWAYYELIGFDLNSMDSGSAIPSTSRDDFYGISVALPPLEIQLAFGEIVSGWFALIYANEAESRDLATLRDTLLPKLLSGEVKVKEFQKEIPAG